MGNIGSVRNIRFLRVGVVLAFVVNFLQIYAYDTEIDGLRYDWVSYYNSTKTAGDVTLVGYNSNSLSENLTIPCFVKWNSKKKGTYNRECQVCTVGESAFQNCSSLQSVDFGCVNSIKSNAFKNCNSLQSVFFSNTLVGILSESFNNCPSLSEIHVDKTTPPSIYQENAFDENTYLNATVYVPKGSVNAYRNADNWNKFVTIIEEPSIYTLSVTALGNGTVIYDGTSVRGETSNFAVTEGCSVTITFNPDTGYRIKSVKVNSTDVTLTVSNNSYTISSITGNTLVEAEFEAIPPTTYTLLIKATGNGSVTYNGTSVKGKTSAFTVNDGMSATITFTPDEGNRIKSLRVNNTDVTSSITNNAYTINNITKDTSVEVVFEAITHTLSIKATGNGSATYNGSSVRGKTNTFTVNDGTSAMITFTPDNGYRIKSVKVNNTDVTSSISNNTYTISNITKDTSVEVVFEAITHTLSIKATGNGSATYSGTSVRGKTSTFTVNEGTSATITFNPDEGNRIKSLKVNNTDVTSSVTNNSYIISSITGDTSVEVVFEAITHTLSITATGNGSATYDGTSVRGKTSTFTVNDGASATITFTPDNGYRIKSVKVNNTDVTSSITNNAYTISSITEDTSVDVVFEAIPHTLSVKATGNGSATYNGTLVRGKTSTFTVNEGTSATITFTPDNYYRIKSVKVNNADVTSNVTNNTYTISSIIQDTSVEVVFEPIPTYTLKITSVGNGVASYNGTAVRAKTSSFTVYEGMEATVVFTPDNGYRIASVKVNDQDVSSGVNNNRYTINSITANTTMSVTFEEIPPTTYSLSITATGNGSVTYKNTTLKNQTQAFTVTEGSYATIAISPESGYRIKSIIQNGVDKTAAVDNNQFTTSKITNDMTVEVEFEAIPIPTYTLSITASGNGTANFLSAAIKNQTQSFSIEEGTAVTITFNPEDGNSVDKVVVNGEHVTAKITGNRYVIESMSENTTVEVTFMEDINALTIDGVNYSVTSQQSRTIVVVGGNYGKVLEVPASVTQNSITWRVMGVEEGALSNNSELAAIIWNPEIAFTASVNNPNLLLYVKDAQYAPTAIHNVVVNGNANDIVLTDAGSGNNFYCPQAFTAQHISYTHNYQMQTGVDDVKGWETIVLPFDVQTISHEVKGSIKPFAAWNSGDVEKPFWLYELTGSGFVPTNSIKAYTPYIISMPNNPQYNSEWQLNGNVTFAASSVTIEKTEDVQKPSFKDRTFIPCFETKGAGEGLYALNVRNLYESNYSGMPDGSMFVLNMRKVHPFEAYLTTSSMARQFIGIFDDMTTDIPMMESIKTLSKETVYDLQGRKTTLTNKKGVYIVNGKKIIK